MKLIIKTSDSYGDKTEETVECIKEVGEKGIRYSYETELGTAKVYLLEDRVQIMRKGPVSGNQIFKLNEETNFLYRTPYLAKNFVLKTKTLDAKEGYIKVCYSLYEATTKINEIDLEIIELQ